MKPSQKTVHDRFREAPEKGSGPFYAIVDCNNFYASCERVFNPALRNKPVVVLSNNDGCVIARSAEAKEAGIPMGAPAFKYEREFQDKGVHVFSSNYALYGDMSGRVVHILRDFCEDVEVYSIDEAFMLLQPPAGRAVHLYGQEIRKRIFQWIGLPVSIGIAPTKTLAKIANHFAKREKLWDGVLHTDMIKDFDSYLKRLPVGEVWGIGKQHKQFLHSHGIESAFDLKQAPESWIKRHMHVTGLRTLRELNGIPSIEMEDLEPRKGILSSRSFRKPVTEYEQLQEAVSAYMSRAAEKLRAQQSVAGVVHVFVKTNRFAKNQPYYSNTATMPLPLATDFTPDLTKAALAGLSEVFLEGHAYQKAGVMLTEIRRSDQVQGNLFVDQDMLTRKKKLANAVDAVNQKMGRNKLIYAVNGIEQAWTMKQEHKSPGYTTRWDELPVAKS
ncbi:DNA polymerase V [Cyclonatronum proteinivorum]|uniref:DNA polymerase V n=1 Tax=Cyclonatronum proteinivorum TaxID=1457365 RepID=A0A345UKC3_9BACT|nr:Y-family DNA polymerase [Cyclonatronum proteinivorum]AXJ00925.1 DNA polymerase V [Cyclonatronum proteinivorum]